MKTDQFHISILIDCIIRSGTADIELFLMVSPPRDMLSPPRDATYPQFFGCETKSNRAETWNTFRTYIRVSKTEMVKIYDAPFQK